MKKLLIYTLIALFPLTTFAQEKNLNFKGISMGENIGDFIIGLQEKGFDINNIMDKFITMEGEFLGEPRTLVIINPNPKTKKPAIVSAFVKAGYKWESIEQKFNDIEKLYIEKYGTQSQQDKYFDGDAYTDFQKLKRIQENLCRYHTTWLMDYGHIDLMLLYYEGEYFITCGYTNLASIDGMLEETPLIDDI